MVKDLSNFVAYNWCPGYRHVLTEISHRISRPKKVLNLRKTTNFAPLALLGKGLVT